MKKNGKEERYAGGSSIFYFAQNEAFISSEARLFYSTLELCNWLDGRGGEIRICRRIFFIHTERQQPAVCGIFCAHARECVRSTEWVEKLLWNLSEFCCSFTWSWDFQRKMNKYVTQTILSLWILLYLRFLWFWPWILEPAIVWGETPYCFVDKYNTFIYSVACSLFLRNVSIHLPNYTAL